MKGLIKIFAFLLLFLSSPISAQTGLDSLALVEAPIYTLEKALTMDPLKVYKLVVSVGDRIDFQLPQQNPFVYKKKSGQASKKRVFDPISLTDRPNSPNKQESDFFSLDLFSIGQNKSQNTSFNPRSPNSRPKDVMGYTLGNFEAIPSEVFTRFPNIQYLKLNGFKLPVLDRRIKNLTQLIQLDLEDSEFTKIPSDIASLAQLQVLHLGKKPNFIPEEITQLTQLHTLIRYA
ncbi:MAG: hypothetical protein AAFU64_15350, partial [Bacteroidota bacterium]